MRIIYTSTQLFLPQLDDRAILFEKQRLRLRRAIQGLQIESPERKTRVGSPQKHTTAAGGAAKSPQPSPTNTHKPNRAPTGSVGGGGSTTLSSSKKTSKMLPKRATEPPMEPIYPWEMSGGEGQSREGSRVGGADSHSQYYHPEVYRDRIYTEEYGAFIPADTQGLYMREEAGGVFGGGDQEEDQFGVMGAGLPDYYVDFQVILSPAEFDAFVSRRNIELKKIKSTAANSAAVKYQDKACKESRFLRTQTPYVDPKRVLQELYRPAHPEKWVDPKGFATVAGRQRDD